MAYDDPLFLGMLGMHGTPVANLAMARADLIIALGIRFDDRATGKMEAFCADAAVIHVDVDESEIGKIRNASLGVCGDAATVLAKILPRMDTFTREGWHGEIGSLNAPAPAAVEIKNPSHPSGIIRYIGNRAPENAIVATDVGQHQMWTAQAYPVRHPRSLLMSGGLGTMGFGVPVAMGAAFANPHKKIVCITGDGSFLMNLQELATLAEHELNVTIVLMDNGYLGLVRQQQEMFYSNHVFASKFTRSPDFSAIAHGFGIRTWDAGINGSNRSAIDEALAFQGPSLVVVPIDGTTNVYPMVPPGASNLEMIQEA
ncbi:thiamine pyrophosphate-dependent enzyme [uncultured Desulfobacter sp.]|uniref:thiamine pyrophosphate-dependent enzyme n=1 Tax=uncultured Desulfobacter sp. TaxID=240139 RepID=UPI002AABF7BB|nr:thiamine pyrophosphate-dependent enzyme [uncultured Desulfobacter sp.]